MFAFRFCATRERSTGQRPFKEVVVVKKETEVEALRKRLESSASAASPEDWAALPDVISAATQSGSTGTTWCGPDGVSCLFSAFLPLSRRANCLLPRAYFICFVIYSVNLRDTCSGPAWSSKACSNNRVKRERSSGIEVYTVYVTGFQTLVKQDFHNQKVCSVESLPTDEVLDEPADTALRILSM